MCAPHVVTLFWPEEFFEYTPGVLRAYVKPKHLDALTFTLQPVIEAGGLKRECLSFESVLPVKSQPVGCSLP